MLGPVLFKYINFMCTDTCILYVYLELICFLTQFVNPI